MQIGVRFRAFVVSLTLAAVCSPVNARDRNFHPYEGTGAIREGRGGRKVDSHGVAIWTTGEPIGPYRILGTIINKPEWMLRRIDLRSEAFAKRVQDAGGDAVIVLHEERGNSGGFAAASGLFSTPQRVTQFVVVKTGE